MHTRSHSTRRLRRRAALLAPALALAPLALVACGSDEDSSSEATAAAGNEAAEGEDEEGEYEIVSDAAVATGLATTIGTLGTLTADPSTATDEAVDEVFEQWETYEGTIKEQEVDSYLSFEDALASFKDAAEAGDAAKMATATEAFSTAAADYLTKHPG